MLLLASGHETRKKTLGGIVRRGKKKALSCMNEPAGGSRSGSGRVKYNLTVYLLQGRKYKNKYGTMVRMEEERLHIDILKRGEGTPVVSIKINSLKPFFFSRL